jgi:hypothetical protein
MNFRRGDAPVPPVGPRRVATFIIDSSGHSEGTPTQIILSGVGAAGANLQLRRVANAVDACTDIGEPYSCCTGADVSDGEWPCGPRLMSVAVPEPGLVLQLMSGLVGLACLYRLRRRA